MLRKLSLLAGLGLGFYTFDKTVYNSTFERNARTLWNGIIIGIDYKLFFNPENSERIEDLNARAAKRIYNVCKKNGGLYIKFGQQIASVPALPESYAFVFKEFYDNAPQVSYETIVKIFKKEFGGKHPLEMFKSFSPKAVASASIAQVHKAELLDGTPVAIKIQKPEIAMQIKWDMLTYRCILLAFEYFFDLPLYWSADYIESHLRQETDFIREAKNSERCMHHINEISELKGSITVPKVYWEYTTPRILCMEWIDGIPLSKPLENVSTSHIMKTLITTFSDQIFRTGFVHFDPHPGNIMVRFKKNRKPQVVLLDHGLYVQCEPKFTHNYALFYKSLVELNTSKMHLIAQEWGITDMQLFASATLQKLWIPQSLQSSNENVKEQIKSLYQKHVHAKEKLGQFLKNSEKIPKELIFIGRNINCVRMNNRALFNPVNRVDIMANYAIKIVKNDDTLWKTNPSMQCMQNQKIQKFDLFSIFKLDTMRLHFHLFLNRLLFYCSKFINGFLWMMTGRQQSRDFDDLAEEAVKEIIQEQYGVTLSFQGFG